MNLTGTAVSSVKLRSQSRRQRRQLAGFLFVLPAVVFTLIFFILPLLMTVWMSLHNWPLMGTARFIGLDNYIQLTQDRQFWNSLVFTTKYTVLVTPVIFVMAFVLAMLVNLPLRGIGVFRTAYFIPYVIGLGTSSLMWVWLLNDRVGVFNGMLLSSGLIEKPVLFLSTYDLSMFSVVVSVVWKTVGFTMVLLLTGMQAIPDELYQAAMVDGAGFFSRMRFITMPLLRRTFALALLLSVIGSYLGFEQFYIMTAGGPQNQTISVVYWIFKNSFTSFKLGYGASLSIVLLFILVALSIIQLRLLRDDASY